MKTECSHCLGSGRPIWPPTGVCVHCLGTGVEPDKQMTTPERIAQMVHERAAKGLEKYGVGIDRKDLTFAQWVRHAQEELLDAPQYLQRVLETHEEFKRGMDGLLREILGDEFNDPTISDNAKLAMAVLRVKDLRSEVAKAWLEGSESSGYGGGEEWRNSRAKRISGCDLPK